MENSHYLVLSADAMTRVLNVYPADLLTNLYNKMLIKLFPDDVYVRSLKLQRELAKLEKKKEEEDTKNVVGEPAKV